MDDGLTQELPKFADVGEALIARSFSGFLTMELIFARTALDALKQVWLLVSMPSAWLITIASAYHSLSAYVFVWLQVTLPQPMPTGKLVEHCEQAHRHVMMDLLNMSIVPRSMAGNFKIAAPPQVSRKAKVRMGTFPEALIQALSHFSSYRLASFFPRRPLGPLQLA